MITCQGCKIKFTTCSNYMLHECNIADKPAPLSSKIIPVTQSALKTVVEELDRAMKAYPKINSPHEGYAILKEEVDELWDEVKKKQAVHDKEAMRKECVQIAAMAIRFMLDCCDEN